jgi:hypothetical protein
MFTELRMPEKNHAQPPRIFAALLGLVGAFLFFRWYLAPRAWGIALLCHCRSGDFHFKRIFVEGKYSWLSHLPDHHYGNCFVGDLGDGI